jgi:hypothetical protein
VSADLFPSNGYVCHNILSSLGERTCSGCNVSRDGCAFTAVRRSPDRDKRRFELKLPNKGFQIEFILLAISIYLLVFNILQCNIKNRNIQ